VESDRRRTAALAIAGNLVVYAQQRGDRDGMMQGWQPEHRDCAVRRGPIGCARSRPDWCHAGAGEELAGIEQAARDMAKQRLEKHPRDGANRGSKATIGRAPASARNNP